MSNVEAQVTTTEYDPDNEVRATRVREHRQRYKLLGGEISA